MRASHIGLLLAGAVLLPLLYCASSGPVWKLHQVGWLPASVGRLYDPLVGPMNRYPSFGAMMMRYQALWGGESPQPTAGAETNVVPVATAGAAAAGK